MALKTQAFLTRWVAARRHPLGRVSLGLERGGRLATEA
jgi:hypothetical protein